jgi:creatinine amidohydrolase/Fe(II)-dependent formamide hydrolase-like protein
MKYPGTISLTEATYQALLTDICGSFKSHGFKRIILIGDSGGNQAGMKSVAEKLNAKWNASPRVIFVPEYYEGAGATEWLQSQGIKQTPEGLHDDFAMSAQLLAVDPRTVRMEQRIKAGNFRINGVELAPAEKTIALGRKIIDLRAEQTVKAIRQHEQVVP